MQSVYHQIGFDDFLHLRRVARIALIEIYFKDDAYIGSARQVTLNIEVTRRKMWLKIE